MLLARNALIEQIVFGTGVTTPVLELASGIDRESHDLHVTDFGRYIILRLRRRLLSDGWSSKVCEWLCCLNHTVTDDWRSLFLQMLIRTWQLLLTVK